MGETVGEPIVTGTDPVPGRRTDPQAFRAPTDKEERTNGSSPSFDNEPGPERGT